MVEDITIMTKISRKKFIRNVSLASAGLAFASCSGRNESADQESGNINFNRKVRWNMVTTWPPNFPVLGEGCNMLADWVNTMSGGQFTIKVYGGGELIPALEAFDAVSSGTAEMASAASYYWAGKVTAAQFFATFPFGFNAQQMNAWLYCGGGEQVWQEVYAEHNLYPLPGGNTGVQMAGWFNRDIETFDDLKGLKMRIPGLGGRVLKEAGGTIVLSPGSEIYTNLERGVIDAAEWIGPYHDYKMGFHQIARNYYYPGWHEPGATLELMVNKRKFEQLPSHLKEILISAAARLNGWMLAEFEAKNAEYLQTIVDEGKVNIAPLPTQVLGRLKEISKDMIADIAAGDPTSKKVVDSISAFRKKIIPWSEMTEKAYYSKL